MPKCPRCGEEISWLKNICEEVCEYYFELDENGEPFYDYIDSWAGDWNNYECPECGEILFTSEEEAIEFLKPKAKL
ncbi:MAG: hypothetical protein QXY07_02645 [Candidatus Bathyarchaeia archaeon]